MTLSLTRVANDSFVVRPSVHQSRCERTRGNYSPVSSMMYHEHAQPSLMPPQPPQTALYSEPCAATSSTSSSSSSYKLAFHDADTDTDTDSPNTATSYVRHARPREEIACVGRKTVAEFGESVSVSVSVSASWNASSRPLHPSRTCRRRSVVAAAHP